jgi:hypothetical protein
MEYETQRLRVLARIPKISRSSSGSDIHLVAPEEDGRLISQTVAFRLLAATALLLLFAAIIPCSIVIGSKTPAPAAATIVDATPTPTATADASLGTPVAAASPQKTDEIPQMSIWPRPDRANNPQMEGRAEGLSSTGNASPAPRAPQYQADARAGY